MTRVVTHELIHAFDHCRAHVDWFNNYRHLACSEVKFEIIKLGYRERQCFCSRQKEFSSSRLINLCFLNKSFFFFPQIRAANLSGDCAFKNEAARFNFGFKQHHKVPARENISSPAPLGQNLTSLSSAQACVRGRALRSILAVRNISREEAEKIVDEVFDTCFKDHTPFGRIPHSKKDAQFAYRDYQNRDRYYANL